MPTCPKCKTAFESKESARQAVRPSLITVNQAKMAPEFIGAVHTPRAHARDFCGTASVLSIGLAGLLGASWGQCFYTGLMMGAAVFGVVRAMGTFQDNRRVDRRDRMAAGMTPQPEPKLKREKGWLGQLFKPPAAMVGSKPPGRLKMAYQFYDIPFANYNEAREVARAYLAKGVPFTRRDLIDAGAIPDDPEHHSKIFNAMMEAGLLLKKGNGGIPNDKGREYLAACLAPPPRL